MTVQSTLRRSLLPGLFVFLVLFGPARPLRAQYMKNEISLSASAGWVFPTGNLAEVYGTGHGLTGGADLFLNPSWALGLRGLYVSHDAKTATATGARRRRSIAGSAEARLFLYPESWFTPFAVGGLGLYTGRRWAGSGDTIAVDDETRIGFTGGFGLSVHRQGSRWSLFSELVYHHLPASTGARQFLVWGSGLRVSFGGRPF